MSQQNKGFKRKAVEPAPPYTPPGVSRSAKYYTPVVLFGSNPQQGSTLCHTRQFLPNPRDNMNCSPSPPEMFPLVGVPPNPPSAQERSLHSNVVGNPLKLSFKGRPDANSGGSVGGLSLAETCPITAGLVAQNTAPPSRAGELSDLHHVVFGTSMNAALNQTMRQLPNSSSGYSCGPPKQLPEKKDLIIIENNNDKEQGPELVKKPIQTDPHLAIFDQPPSFSSSSSSRSKDASPVPPATAESNDKTTTMKSPHITTSESSKPCASKDEETATVSPNTSEAGYGTSENSEMKGNASPQPSFSFTLTEIEDLEDDDCFSRGLESPATHDLIEGIKVKQAYAPTARIIMARHPDIFAKTKFVGNMLSIVLENVCEIYKKLENEEFGSITISDLTIMRADIHDIEKENIGVQWLSERLDCIIAAKKLLQDAPKLKKKLKDFQRNHDELEKDVIFKKMTIQELQLEVEEIEEEKKVVKSQAATVYQNLTETKDAAKKFHKKSLVDGL